LAPCPDEPLRDGQITGGHRFFSSDEDLRQRVELLEALAASDGHAIERIVAKDFGRWLANFNFCSHSRAGFEGRRVALDGPPFTPTGQERAA